MGYLENQVFMAKDGDIIEITQAGAQIKGSIEVSNVYIDGLGVGDVGNIVLRDRQKMSEEGVVVVMIPLDRRTGKLRSEPDVISRGFVFGEEGEDMMAASKEIVKSFVSRQSNSQPDWKNLRHEIEDTLGKFFYEETKRNPLILSIVVEV